MDFLFENPIILVILVGIISSLYKQVKGVQPEEGKGRNIPKKAPVSPVGKNKSARKEKHSNKPVGRQNVASQSSPNQQNSNREIEDLYVATRKLAQENKQTSLDMNKNTATTQLKEEDKKKTLNINQSNLVDGLIWSEVLGPPRAKRPHRSIR